MRRLAIVVSTGVDLPAAFDLAHAARESGIEVGMFFMSDALPGLPARRGEMASLADDGCEIAVCAASAAAHGLGASELGLELGGQDDHAAIVSRADRVIAFT
jgi:sulfur relay (sulfurtransferase) complex TusBCD TusD component (DsrE family)